MMKTALDEITRVLSSLPVTADGQYIVPDMFVYCINGEHIDERKVLGPYGKQALLTLEPARHGVGTSYSHRLANTVYASREEALAFLKQVKP